MSTDIAAIKFILQRELQDSNIDSATVLIWCNNAQSDFGAAINAPDTNTISITTTELTYALPTDLKIITRLWSQTDYDNGIDRALTDHYRIFNGNIIFPTYFREAFTLNVDYYKLLKYFTAETDVIDIDDRYYPIYTYYGKAMYYKLPLIIEKVGVNQAETMSNTAMNGYNNIKSQVFQQYLFRNEPSVVNERW